MLVLTAAVHLLRALCTPTASLQHKKALSNEAALTLLLGTAAEAVRARQQAG